VATNHFRCVRVRRRISGYRTFGRLCGFLLGYMLRDLGIETKSIPIWSDSQAALALIKNPMVSQRSKHIDVAYHFVRERAENGAVSFDYATTEEMAADCFTKPVPPAKLEFCKTRLGMK
jgi:hypothetical protein